MGRRPDHAPITIEWLKSNTITDERGCWIWKNGCNDKGYSVVRANGKATLGHRLIWSMVNGPIPIGLNVLHDCDVRGCINPDHLYVGTQMQNIHDAIDRGRFRGGVARGDQSGHNKLIERDVLFIRQSTLSAWRLAEQFNVSPSCIRAARRRETWTHI